MTIVTNQEEIKPLIKAENIRIASCRLHCSIIFLDRVTNIVHQPPFPFKCTCWVYRPMD